MAPLTTPDGRYIIVRGRLWRAANPHLDTAERTRLTGALMDARRRVGLAMRLADTLALRKARSDVQTCKVALGERGPVWWNDGTPDLNRKLVRNTPYASWYGQQEPAAP